MVLDWKNELIQIVSYVLMLELTKTHGLQNKKIALSFTVEFLCCDHT